MRTNTQEAVLSACIASIGKRTRAMPPKSVGQQRIPDHRSVLARSCRMTGCRIHPQFRVRETKASLPRIPCPTHIR